MNDGKAGRSGMHPEVKQVDIGPLCCFFTISQREPDRFRAEAMKHEQRVLEEGAAAGYAAPTLSIQTTDRVSYLEFRGGLDGIQIYLRVDRSVHPEYGLGIDHIAAVVDEMILKMVASWTQGQTLPVPMPLPRNADGKVACRSRLGGMLNFYYREAALPNSWRSPNNSSENLPSAAPIVASNVNYWAKPVGDGFSDRTGYVDWQQLLDLLQRFPPPRPRNAHRYGT
jgi:hypothetical protein